MNGFKHWPLVLCTGAIVSTLMLCTYSINATVEHNAVKYSYSEFLRTAASINRIEMSGAEIEKTLKSMDQRDAEVRFEASQRRLMGSVSR